jgi:hypothetical protein
MTEPNNRLRPVHHVVIALVVAAAIAVYAVVTGAERSEIVAGVAAGLVVGGVIALLLAGLPRLFRSRR